MTAGHGTAQFRLAIRQVVAIIARHNTFALGTIGLGASALIFGSPFDAATAGWVVLWVALD